MRAEIDHALEAFRLNCFLTGRIRSYIRKPCPCLPLHRPPQLATPHSPEPPPAVPRSPSSPDSRHTPALPIARRTSLHASPRQPHKHPGQGRGARPFRNVSLQTWVRPAEPVPHSSQSHRDEWDTPIVDFPGSFVCHPKGICACPVAVALALFPNPTQNCHPERSTSQPVCEYAARRTALASKRLQHPYSNLGAC